MSQRAKKRRKERASIDCPRNMYFSPCFISHPLRSAPCQNSMSPVEGLEPRAWARNDMVGVGEERERSVKKRSRSRRRESEDEVEQCFFFFFHFFFLLLLELSSSLLSHARARAPRRVLSLQSRLAVREHSCSWLLSLASGVADASEAREREKKERGQTDGRERRERSHERPRECLLDPFSCPPVVLRPKRKALCLLRADGKVEKELSTCLLPRGTDSSFAGR